MNYCITLNLALFSKVIITVTEIQAISDQFNEKTWLMLLELNFQQFPFLSKILHKHPVYTQINFSFKNTYINSGFKY